MWPFPSFGPGGKWVSDIERRRLAIIVAFRDIVACRRANPEVRAI
jgi:hypothetical protein